MIHNLERKRLKRQKRKRSIRRKIIGTVERPRLTIFRSQRHTYAQVIDDLSGHTLAAASTRDKEILEALKDLKKSDQAGRVGELLARRCQEKGIRLVVFDRNGYAYHGRVAKIAAAAREKGLSF